MKRIINITILISCLIISLISCEIDNYEGPNASFYGSIIDNETGALVGTELINGSTIRAFEQGFETPVAQTWLIKNTGEFRNDMVFAGTYNFDLSNGNFYPISVENFKINSGDNQHDFRVTPYIRIKNVNISHSNNQIIATFSLEAGEPEVKVKSIRLYAFTDMHVGENIKFSTSGTNFLQNFSPSKTIDNSVYTLTIELGENENHFKYNRNYYFRIGALADVTGVGTVRHNYSTVEVIPL
jgi:hypothetical protein